MSRTQSVRAERRGEDSQCWRRRGGACGGCRLPPGGASSFSPFFPPILSPVASVSTFPPLPGCSILFLACLGARKSRTPGGTGAWGAASLSEGKAGKSQGLAGRAGPLWLASYFQSGVHVFESCIFLCNPVSYEAQNRKAGAMFLAWGKQHPRCTGQETNQLPLPFPPSIGTGRETMARND